MGPRCRTLQSVKTHTDESHLGVCVCGGGGGGAGRLQIGLPVNYQSEMDTT